MPNRNRNSILHVELAVRINLTGLSWALTKVSREFTFQRRCDETGFIR